MTAVKLLPHQEEALPKIESGKVLWGGVGSGKSITILSYYLQNELLDDIVVITTAKKRDDLEWERDAAMLGIGASKGASVAGTLTVDSWNNISKYEDVDGGFFIFDEQRVVGNGAWVQSFLKIARNPRNFWVLLSATPGDTWIDYIPIFVANGYYKNPTAFKREHVVYSRFSRFPRIERYLGTQKLERLRNEVLVEMPYIRHTTRHHIQIDVDFDQSLVDTVMKKRWHPIADRPIREVSDMWATLRRVVYSDPSRLEALVELMDKHPRIIVFYNFNYELQILRELNNTWSDLYEVAEYNGHKKQPVPDSERWVYFVQYTAGSEGWNCTSTDAIAYYSLPYSYKKWEQSQGRIDRLNTYFSDLYYYSFVAKSVVDKAVRKSLDEKETFNERKFLSEFLPEFDNFDMFNE